MHNDGYNHNLMFLSSESTRQPGLLWSCSNSEVEAVFFQELDVCLAVVSQIPVGNKLCLPIAHCILDTYRPLAGQLWSCAEIHCNGEVIGISQLI